jgi:L-seryl-tRNA(Ser) seleniumtransferase
VRGWLRQLLGAESGTVVNNNAAATVLTLRALARDREVVVSRGELVEIGGSFRIPEIMAVSGARLREVGTTNITRISDYAAAITADTAALLRVHTSNYRVIGHVETPTLAERIQLARQHGLLMIDDVGSGALLDFEAWGLSGEPQPRESLAAGADLVLFSGDKLLGGPQCGIIAGRAELITRIERDPLMRAFRLDKMTLAALEATLRIYAAGGPALQRLPLVQMLETPLAVLQARAAGLAEALRTLPHVVSAEAKEDVAFMGGGSLPSQSMPTWVVAVKVSGVSESELARRLRMGRPAVMPRVQEGQLLLDLRTVMESQLESLQQACAAAAAAG